MKTLLSCEFNMDTGCVELKYSNGSIISINCTAVEDEVANSRFQRSELDWLIYNDPLSYAELILNGDPEEYLRTVTETPQLDFDYKQSRQRHIHEMLLLAAFTFLSIKANTTACCSSLNLDHRSRSLLLRISQRNW